MRATFARTACLLLKGFCGPSILRLIDPRLLAASFTARVEGGVEIEEVCTDPNLLDLLHFHLSRQTLFRYLEALTGCSPIGSFCGRVYARRAKPGTAHFFDWHQDTTDARLLGLSLNLSPNPFRGGAFQIRKCGSSSPPHEVVFGDRGDAIVFSIDRALVHRVAWVESAAPRVVFAGWFVQTPTLHQIFGKHP
jgi:hypothetical protein